MCSFWHTKWISICYCTFFVFILVISGKFASGFNYKVNLNDATTNFRLQVNSSSKECGEDRKTGMVIYKVDMFYEIGCNRPYAQSNLSSPNDERQLILHIKDKCDYQRNCSLTKSDLQFSSTCNDKCSCPFLYYIAYSCKRVARATTQTTHLSTVTSVKMPKGSINVL
ncbi:uncharacterized protein LOC131955114 [Physella acuta]|uniref:uncharacterized protein LOC131955114 n=1 Tax=Physella acuta TaxID=109671 RepID=UPI0027DC653F|nr:uncharacterized protein LOC131955114 [Physella acuta]